MYTKEKLFSILRFLEVSPYLFSLRELSDRLDSIIVFLILECRLFFNDITSEDVISTTNIIKDIIFAMKNKHEFLKDKEMITKEEFTKLITSQSSGIYEIYVLAVFKNITKTDRDMTVEEFKENFL